MNKFTNKYLIYALLLGVIFHGILIFFTLESTYDALIHLFFGNHYATSWFEPWNYSWYTGFTVMGYPPLVHQSIGLLSYIAGLKFGLFSVAIIAIILFITGVYRYALVLTSHRKVAGYTAILAVFSTAFIETLHIFGQLPSIVGISILLHALPEIYLWIKIGKYKYLWKALSLIAVTVASHHITTIFGMVFFIFPLIGMAVMDGAKEKIGTYKDVRVTTFIKTFLSLLKRIVCFGFGSLTLIIVCIFPYWINTKNNPITQVPIPHGSRDNFFEVASSGLIFFLIPWGILLFFMPYIWYRFFSKRYLFFGLSFTLLTILGTGGTTPIPKVILGENAFNILTLDRFTLWASLMALPIFGEFGYRFVKTDLREKITQDYGQIYHRIVGGLITVVLISTTFFTVCLGYFRSLQPQKIKMLPILNFLRQDQHDHWRYLPLGFGDQMAWLSAQTEAMTVDGNYHSARRLPELTSKAVERLENSKFRGVEGIGSLQQFLTVPEKYNLKYVFSNDKFYDPLLYFCGWQRLRRLENGIMVWEKLNVPPLSNVLPKDDVPLYQKLMWGLIPICTVLIAFFVNIQPIWIQELQYKNNSHPIYFKFGLPYKGLFKNSIFKVSHIWALFMTAVFGVGIYLMYIKNAAQIKPYNVVKSYYDALDFKEFKQAYSYINPLSNTSLDQFMLEVSVTDGLLSSYAKLDEIDIEIISRTDTIAKAKVVGYWVTSLERIPKTFYHELVKQKGKWYLQPSDYDLDIPPDQLFTSNKSLFYNHGRRRITSEQTHHEDVLKQPVLEVLQAKVIKRDGQYHIIGALQNVDNVPADVVISGTLYTKKDIKLARFNVKDQMKHKLMPKEVTSFRIDFEEIAWKNKEDRKPNTFDPNQFTSVDITQVPNKFDLQCAGNVTTVDLYKDLVLNSMVIKENRIQGVLFNSGLKEVTIPQLLISYYDQNKNIIWVDHHYLSKGIRPQRKQFFEYDLLDLSDLEKVNETMEYVFVNGLSNQQISRNMVPNRNKDHVSSQLLSIQGKGFSHIKFEMNSYIGSSN
ncbi:hypothetical protein J8281_05465 [Aquimarina sp. U1-2]|uniref:hypothetical protein n=1 Tax=Aquimarina sp. U1-2 TaxID=2823141 RepID=UPI001AECE8F6|nr:hypothetical protein [Aquimarina sp. U1-2]MBP2831632.1 hypothetical protein [Aquimarina sp. U1-2]